jgi:hypothetical protein
MTQKYALVHEIEQKRQSWAAHQILPVSFIVPCLLQPPPHDIRRPFRLRQYPF